MKKFTLLITLSLTVALSYNLNAMEAAEDIENFTKETGRVCPVLEISFPELIKKFGLKIALKIRKEQHELASSKRTNRGDDKSFELSYQE